MESWLSLWSVGPRITRDDFLRIEDASFRGVEIWGEHEQAQQYLQWAVESGLKTSTHLPFHDLNLATPDSEVARHAVRVLKDWLVRLGESQSRHAVLHGGYAWASEHRDKAIAVVTDRLQELGQLAKDSGVDLLLENLPPDHLNYTHPVACKTDEWFALLATCNLNACLDIGHLYMSGGEAADAVTHLGERLKSVHYSDNDRASDQHLMPGDGSSITNGFTSLLAQSGYDGALVYEINPYRYKFHEILERVKAERR